MHFLIPLIRLQAANAGRMDLSTDTKLKVKLDWIHLCYAAFCFKSTIFNSLLLNDLLDESLLLLILGDGRQRAESRLCG